MTKPDRKLSTKQNRFCEEYQLDLNASRAAERAGYRHPNKQGPRMLVKVGIAEAIAAALAERSKKVSLAAEDVIRGLMFEANNRGEGSTHSARVAAWAHLGKHLGMFTDRQEINLNHGVQQMDEDELEAHARELAGRLGITLPDVMIVRPEGPDD